VDVNRFTTDAHARAGRDTTGQRPELHVLYVGRLTYYKGVRYLIEAAARVKDLRLDLVGDGDQAEELKALTATLGLEDRVTFHGSLPDHELASFMCECDCLCLPSIERTEAFGLVLLEAMFFGKAVVIADVSGSGMGWIVDNGVTGVKVKPRDAAALTDAFFQLEEQQTQLQAMGVRGKEKFEKMLEIQQAASGIWDIYQLMIPENATKTGQTACR
jgi:rhamnosyl/mannosyltransferase